MQQKGRNGIADSTNIQTQIVFRPNFSISLNALFSQSQTTSATVLLHEGSIRRKIKYVTKKLAVNRQIAEQLAKKRGKETERKGM